MPTTKNTDYWRQQFKTQTPQELATEIGLLIENKEMESIASAFLVVVESMGKSDTQGVSSLMKNIMEHIHKLNIANPNISTYESNVKDWNKEITGWRRTILDDLVSKPSIKPKLPALLSRNQSKAKTDAIKHLIREIVTVTEKDLPDLTLEQVLPEHMFHLKDTIPPQIP